MAAVALFIVALSIFNKKNVNQITLDSASDKRFEQLADDYFDTFYFPAYPTIATQLGVHTYDDKIEDYSSSAINQSITHLKAWQEKIQNFNPLDLSESTRADRELVLNNIKAQLLTLEVIKPWDKNPDIYSSGVTYSAFVIISRKFASDTDRLKLLVAREKLMPAVLAAARVNINNPPRIYTEIALEQLPGIISFFQHDVPDSFASVKDQSLLNEFKSSNMAVIQALEDYQAWLAHDLLAKSHGDFRIGATVFRQKLAFDEMVDTPLDELLELDRVDMRANQQAFTRITMELDQNKTPMQVLAEMTSNHPPADEVLTAYASTFDDLIKFINEKNIITIPSEVKPTLEESPPFLRAMTLASMDTPGPFEKVATEAFFNVTLPDKKWDKIKTNEFLRQFNFPAISDISIHETYPGHYVQFLWIHNIKSRVRKILGSSTNAEGWAHYCEQMMLDEGYGKKNGEHAAKLLRLGQLHEALLRNARFIVGIEMHTGKMTYEQAIKFFIKEAYIPEPGAIIEAKRGTMDPTYLYYTLGKLQILKLRADLEAKEGANFSLKKFHDDFMQQGFPPIKIVRKALLHDDSPTI